MATSSPLRYVSKLAGRHILILGGTSGIGFCVAQAALGQGARVVVAGSNRNKLDDAVKRLQEADPSAVERCSGQTCDLSHPDTLESNLENILKAATQQSKLDHIVFTAGDSFTITPIKDVTVEYIQRAGVVRFLGPLFLAKLATSYLNSSSESSITLTSGANSSKPSPGWTVMAAYGAASEGMGRGLAVDLKPIRVNVVSPGAVHTELFNDIPHERLESVLEKMRDKTLVGHVGQPQDVAEAYIYAMKDRFVTGTVLHSNGGSFLA